MVNTLSGNMTTNELERAIDILVDSATLEELETESFDSIVVDKMVTIIHMAIAKQGKVQVAY